MLPTTRAPHEFPRRILLVVTGLSPQVVTETLYALAVTRETPFVPTEVHVISTQEGAKRAKLTLLDAGHFQGLCNDYGLSHIEFSPAHIHIVGAENNQPLNDIRTDEENAQMADSLLAKMRELTADENAALHVSIAGGRKTMGFYLGYCLSLLARPQDRLSHVLVSEYFESHPDFFYPPKIGKVLYTRDNRPLHTDDAKISLADIPFVRLRRGIPFALRDGQAGFNEIVSGTEKALPFPTLEFFLKGNKLFCSGKKIKLEPQQFAFYLWLANSRKYGLGDQRESGFWHWKTEGENIQSFLGIYARIVGKNSRRYENTEASLALDAKLATKQLFGTERVSKINKELKDNLGDIEAIHYSIQTSRDSVYGINLPAEAIIIHWEK